MEEDNFQINNKKTFLSILGVAILVVGLVGITYAFFNYTRTGSANTIKVGRIAFNSNQTETINLINAFPISSTDALSDTTNSDEIVISITGDTTYDNGVEYLIKATNVSNTINSKVVPINILVRTSNGLGTANDDYFVNRGRNSSIYKILSDGTIENGGRILVGYIAPGETGINGSVTIKAYLDSSNIAISDTYDIDNPGTDNNGTTTDWVDARTVLTASEWNSIQTNGVSFKVKVEANEGTWVESDNRLYTAIVEGESNGSSQSTPTIPLDNENSSYVQNVSTDSITKTKAKFLDANNVDYKAIKLSNGIDFSRPADSTNGKGLYMRAGTENYPYPIMYYRGEVYNNNVAFAGFCWLIVRTTETGGIKMIYNGEQDANGTCLPASLVTNVSAEKSEQITVKFLKNEINNQMLKKIGASSEVSDESNEELNETSSETSPEIPDYVVGESSGESSENTNEIRRIGDQIVINDGEYYDFQKHTGGSSFSDIGYMYGVRYPTSDRDWKRNVYFGSGFTYENGVYKLTDATVRSPNNTHHYSCNSYYADGTCESIRFVFFGNIGSPYYIVLTDGDGIEQALEKMHGNTTDSSVKAHVDNWYENNLVNYTDKLEDTIWCNDRSISKGAGWSSTGTIEGNNVNEYSTFFSAYDRVVNTHIPSLTCSDPRDRFTVSSENGNGALTYPIGMLTVDEVMLAGESGSNQTNDTYYLYTGYYYWSMSPSRYIYYNVSPYYYPIGKKALGHTLDNIIDSSATIRPAISLKHGTIILDNGADGTAGNPYIVE